MNKTKVVVFIDGGRVDQVLSNWTVEMVVVDCDLDDISTCIQVEYNKEEGVFIFGAKDTFCNDALTKNVCLSIGKLLSSAGLNYLEFAFSQTASRIIVRSHRGGCFLIYSDGRLSWSKDVWPVI